MCPVGVVHGVAERTFAVPVPGQRVPAIGAIGSARCGVLHGIPSSLMCSMYQSGGASPYRVQPVRMSYPGRHTA